MIERALYPIAFSEDWGRQMRFISGPRQFGKTTLAKLKLRREKTSSLYYLWDLREVRKRYKQNQLFFTEDSPPKRHKQWVCFDEIHKLPKWKNALKAVFDGTEDAYQFVITGSAKFDIFKRAGDSLSGRFFTFHLFPLMLCELMKSKPRVPANASGWIQQALDTPRKNAASALRDLLAYSGFPDPFLHQSKAFYSKWLEDYTDTVIKEDIGSLTRILDKEHLYDLYHLLPQVVGSPLSEASLARHLEISNPTLKNYLRRLGDFYLSFKIHPYSKNIKRSLLKAPKGYVYNWSLVEDEANRFENYIACELMAKTSLWSAASGEKFSLYYVRNKQRQETDFLIVKNKAPWMLLEAKLSDKSISSHHYQTQAMLGDIPFVQLCQEEGVCLLQGRGAYRISASRFFSA